MWGKQSIKQPTPPLSHMTTALMAIDHFNARDPVVVPQLANVDWGNCCAILPTRLSPEATNDGYRDPVDVVANKRFDADRWWACTTPPLLRAWPWSRTLRARRYSCERRPTTTSG